MEDEILDAVDDNKEERDITFDMYPILGASIVCILSFTFGSFLASCGFNFINFLIALVSTGGFIALQYMLRKKSAILRWTTAIVLSSITLYIALLSFYVIC